MYKFCQLQQRKLVQVRTITIKKYFGLCYVMFFLGLSKKVNLLITLLENVVNNLFIKMVLSGESSGE